MIWCALHCLLSFAEHVQTQPMWVDFHSDLLWTGAMVQVYIQDVCMNAHAVPET